MTPARPHGDGGSGVADDAATVRRLVAAAHLPASDAELARLTAAYRAFSDGIDALYSAVADLDAGSAQVLSITRDAASGSA